jgi:hypothetical protein
MTVTILLRPDTEAKLLTRAAATGKDVPTLVREAVEEKLAVSGEALDKNGQEWATEFDVWMRDVEGRAGMYPPGYAADDSRENLYDGSDE